MPEKNRKDWAPFGVVKPGKHNGWSNTECCDLVEISHVTHNRFAADILDRGMIRAGLVYDKSILNRRRILVNWLSPNDWANVGGSRYGNVSFEFNWPALLDGMQCFWVGSMDYSPIAVRILLSKQDHSELLKPYDAKSGTGPWWYDVATHTHYWNGKYCLEVMLERDLDLDELLTLGAVKHHEKRCNISPGTCPDGGDTSSKGMARLIAMLVAQGITPARPSLTFELTLASQLK